jgi:hypothetical protein
MSIQPIKVTESAKRYCAYRLCQRELPKSRSKSKFCSRDFYEKARYDKNREQIIVRTLKYNQKNKKDKVAYQRGWDKQEQLGATTSGGTTRTYKLCNIE